MSGKPTPNLLRFCLRDWRQLQAHGRARACRRRHAALAQGPAPLRRPDPERHPLFGQSPAGKKALPVSWGAVNRPEDRRGQGEDRSSAAQAVGQATKLSSGPDRLTSWSVGDVTVEIKSRRRGGDRASIAFETPDLHANVSPRPGIAECLPHCGGGEAKCLPNLPELFTGHSAIDSTRPYHANLEPTGFG
jgi:hypothetical protein